MSLRLLQIVLPSNRLNRLEHILDESKSPHRWRTDLGDDNTMTSVLIPSLIVEPLTDALNEEFKLNETFRLVLLPVEATHPPLPAPAAAPKPETKEEKKWSPRFGRVSREELILDIEGSARANPVYLIMVALATIVACVGLIKGSAAIIIGAMVIAPLLGPNMALALGTTLGEIPLIRRAIKSNLLGLSLALAFAIPFGFFIIPADLNGEIDARTVVDLGDILLALASGAAGAIAFTSGASATVVGVMGAVALLPPSAVCVMLLGAREWLGAGDSA
ncbi:MAG: TIGR00341 family protein, partial [Phycisphaerales bacterium]